MPGPHGNTNGAKHGRRIRTTTGSVLSICGKSPLKSRGGRYLRGVLRSLQRELVAEIQRLKARSPSAYEQALIQSATRHECRAKLLERLLGEKTVKGVADPLTLQDRVLLLREIGNATDARDKCLKSLGLDREQGETLLDALYSKPQAEQPDAQAGVQTFERQGDA